MAAESPAPSAISGPPRAQLGVLGECSVWGTRLTDVPAARKLLDGSAQFAHTCQDFASGIVDACGPKSPDSHRVIWGLTARPPVSPGGLSSGFPFARRVLCLRLPSSGFPSSGVLRFGPFGRCPVPAPLRFPSGFPSRGCAGETRSCGPTARRAEPAPAQPGSAPPAGRQADQVGQHPLTRQHRHRHDLLPAGRRHRQRHPRAHQRDPRPGADRPGQPDHRRGQHGDSPRLTAATRPQLLSGQDDGMP